MWGAGEDEVGGLPLFFLIKDGGDWGGSEGGPASIRVVGVGIRGSGGRGLARVFSMEMLRGWRSGGGCRENGEGGESPLRFTIREGRGIGEWR